MHITTASLKSPILILICSGAIFIGCGGGGGGSDNAGPDATSNVFSPAAYEEATSANESLSGVWLMLEEYQYTDVYTYGEYGANVSTTEITVSENRRRELFVITDTDTSPTGAPRISSCGRPENLVIQSTSVSFFDNDATYTATISSNTRIAGSSHYESYRDASDDSPAHSQQGTFTLIKIAPLPENFEVDASSDAYGYSYTRQLEPIGTVTAQGQYSGESQLIQMNGPAKCFAHSEGTFTVTENSVTTDRGSYVRFSAGANESPDVEIHSYQSESGDDYLQIDAYHPPYQHFEIDNSVFDAVTGTSTFSITGSKDIVVDSSIQGAEEGDAEVTIDINLP